jgi:hypothetical protein
MVIYAVVDPTFVNTVSKKTVSVEKLSFALTSVTNSSFTQELRNNAEIKTMTMYLKNFILNIF